jgi:DhnA family fructose-bisphosphate aldolase class Ia
VIALSIGKEYRLGRILRDGRALIIAMDHGHVGGPLKGIEKPEETIRKVIAGGADAVMTTFGNLQKSRRAIIGKVPTIMRLDGGPTMLGGKFHEVPALNQLNSVEDAIKMGADGVIQNALIGIPAEMSSLKNLAATAANCENWGMPLTAEALVGGFEPTEKFKNIHDPEYVAFAARVASEYGADMIKTWYTGSPETFRKVTSTCPAPVLIAGGPPARTERDVLVAVKGMIEGGGAGVFFGRNIWQSRNPEGMTRALRRIIHDGDTVDTAMKELA